MTGEESKAETASAALAAEALCWRCPSDHFTFETTEDLEALSEVIGQDRAVEAIRFAIGMRQPGYNLYALGPEGMGKHTAVRRFLEEQAKQEMAPPDWCYVSNFKDRRKPHAFQLPAGRGGQLREDMSHFVVDLRDALRNGFESDEYRTRRKVIEEEFKERQDKALQAVEQDSRAQGMALMRTPMGFAFAPTRDGEVIAPEAFQKLPEDERKRIEGVIQGLQEKLQEVLHKAPVWMKETREKLRQLNDETALFATAHLIDALKERYSDIPAVQRFLDEVRDDAVEHVEEIVAEGPTQKGDRPAGRIDDDHPILRRYGVNLIVDNAESTHAPVIYEDDPSYDRLIGRIEHRAEMGTLLTDFHLIRGGALHRASGGYLILDARKLLTQPMAWDALKRALFAGELRIQSAAQALGMLSTVSLEPEPIPLDVKVVIVGERMIYYALAQLDPEFQRLFKVPADFDERIPRNEANDHLYARLVKSLTDRENLKPFHRGAVARALEFSARAAGDAERFSMDIERLADLLREADYLAGKAGRDVVRAEAVAQAADAQIYRLDRMRERLQEEIERGTVQIDTDGAKSGQINGLSVMSLGGFAFGKPSRITARIRLGRGEVVDIEREVELGGPLHSKGVLILSGYLSAHYASERPLSLSASLVFEQSYGGVDGDSASSAELYALLSAIAEVPIDQSLAVTGSVNQYGEVQAIGGVNEKIEGFFDLCRARGLTGRQGVLIPASNVKHLMLHRRVVEAAEQGQFRIFAVKTIDQGLEILTGQPAGARDGDGRFPADSVNARVEARLIELADKRRAFGRLPEAEGGVG
ncbi:MAG: ATP-binding protein [Kiloniellales bacterium]|nr:ATP-binding protein [Kiloniellales bacterium]